MKNVLKIRLDLKRKKKCLMVFFFLFQSYNNKVFTVKIVRYIYIICMSKKRKNVCTRKYIVYKTKVNQRKFNVF